MRTWQKGYSVFHSYAEMTVRCGLEDARRQRNNLLRVESPFSLDQPITSEGGDQRTFIMYARQTGDFVNSLVFKDFLAGLPPALGKTARSLIKEYEPEEILKKDHLSQRELERHMRLLQQHWQQYNAEIEDVA